MRKRVLIISASPRKGGNSDTLCDRFQQGAAEAHHHVERVFLADRTIGYCAACSACRGSGECVQDDDMRTLLESMIAADVIVLATPVYFFGMCAQLKTVIDRTVARYTAIANKEFYFIVTAAVGSKRPLERTMEGLRGFTSCLTGAKEKGIVYGTGAWEIGDILSRPAFEEAYEMGKSV
ncbi:flavodoxin family protein [Anaeromyxobacter oryzisoli]|uniref:flavodoxin family protein n=1 Tax=Anaeromyxobacter oryzisoli TaxID=2925408 RepID=UPI001F585322|nr:flavodoxin family protein [Anaeromyxobacter sp. SG63]